MKMTMKMLILSSVFISFGSLEASAGGPREMFDGWVNKWRAPKVEDIINKEEVGPKEEKQRTSWNIYKDVLACQNTLNPKGMRVSEFLKDYRAGRDFEKEIQVAQASMKKEVLPPPHYYSVIDVYQSYTPSCLLDGSRTIPTHKPYSYPAPSQELNADKPVEKNNLKPQVQANQYDPDAHYFSKGDFKRTTLSLVYDESDNDEISTESSSFYDSDTFSFQRDGEDSGEYDPFLEAMGYIKKDSKDEEKEDKSKLDFSVKDIWGTKEEPRLNDDSEGDMNFVLTLSLSSGDVQVSNINGPEENLLIKNVLTTKKEPKGKEKVKDD